MNNLDDLRKRWLHYISEGKNKQLLDEMFKYLNPVSKSYSACINLHARHKDKYRHEMQGTIHREDAVVESNQIIKALTDLVQNIETDDLSNEINLAPGIDMLDSLAQKLDVQIPLSLIHLVNCNRIDAQGSFLSTYRRWKSIQQTSQFYFILACPTQEPEGFTERMIYMLKHNYEDNHQSGFNYERMETGRVRMVKLPLGLSLEDSQEELKKYFAKRFNLNEFSFEDYLNNNFVPQYEYVATVFSITAPHWEPELLEAYLEWIIESFVATEAKAPNFLFFFVISLKNAHKKEDILPKDQIVLSSVKDLVDRNSKYAALINNLPPVKYTDFEYWLEDLCRPNQSQKDAIIQAIVERLNSTEKEHFKATQEINMEHFEDFQERVYKFHSSY